MQLVVQQIAASRTRVFMATGGAIFLAAIVGPIVVKECS